LPQTHLACACGKVRLDVVGAPIINAECHCTSCRSAGTRLGALPGMRPILEPNGGVRYVLYRKDRIVFVAGMDLLREFRLTPQSPTRRVVASCCNTPIFTEFDQGHWLSLFGGLWPAGTLPPLDLRTQTDNRAVGEIPADGVPAGTLPTLGFYGRLLGAWIAMGFRTPKIVVNGAVDA
jgi:hypothetical protein